MTSSGLVPYSLKFASDVGRDKWIADAAVDGLNDLILNHRLPRGCFSEYDLRPMAFLQDPDGEHARLQLQVSHLANCWHLAIGNVANDALIKVYFLAKACLQPVLCFQMWLSQVCVLGSLGL